MKQALLALAFLSLPLIASAQGKITIRNDDTRLVEFISSPAAVKPADASLAGQPVPTTGALPSGVYLVFGLYAGTSASTMSLVTGVPAGQTLPAVVPINTAAGTGLPGGWITPTHAILPFEGGTLAVMQVRIWESPWPSFEAALASMSSYATAGYLGESPIFTMTPGLSTRLTYPGINNGGGSTWSGPVLIGFVPEPSTFALAGLGAAAMLIFRRRK